MDATFSFGPAGTYSMFNAGVVYYIKQNIPVDLTRATAYTVSGGGIGLILFMYDTAEEILERSFGACHLMGKLIRYRIPFLHTSRLAREGLDYLFPDDAHLRLGNRISVGLTHFPSFQRYVKRGPFATKAELIDAVLASSFIPGFFTNPIVAHRGYIDGGFSHAFCKRTALSVVVSASKYPESDVYHSETGYHLNLLSTEQYIQLFWDGVEAARKSHDKIIAKLRASGMLIGTETAARQQI